MKKYLGLLVALLLCAVLLSGCSDGATKGEYFTYIVETDGTATITGYIGNERAVVIPKKIDGHKICAIADNAFASNTLITTVTIQKGIQSIGESAFRDTEITSITIPEGITGIEIGTFANCSRLKEVNLPDSIAYIGGEAFYSCKSLKEIIIPDSVRYIGNSAFAYCESLAKITMPTKINSNNSSFAEIDEFAFSNCGSLREFTVPEGVHTISGGAFWECSSLKEITIPASVTTIDEVRRNKGYIRAFSGCHPQKINVKEGSYAAEYFKNHKGLTFY